MGVVSVSRVAGLRSRLAGEAQAATVSPTRTSSVMLRAAMDDVRAELQAAEDEARQQAASLRQRARRLRLRGFGNLADELEAHAVALHETADTIVTQLQELPSPSASAWRAPAARRRYAIRPSASRGR